MRTCISTRLVKPATIVLAALLLTSQCVGQGTTRFITFDGQPIVPRGAQHLAREYSEAGVWFRPVDTYWNTFTRNGGGIPFYPENGTAYLQAGFTDSLSFGFTAGTIFSLESVDLAEYSTVVSNSASVYFIGYRHDGTVITNILTTDGIIDGTGPAQDFETLHFSSEMRNLERVEIPLWSYGWSLDNLVVSTPEPGTPALVMLAALTFWQMRRVSSRRTGQV